MNTENLLELLKLISNKYSEHTEVEYNLHAHNIEVRLYEEKLENGKKVENEIIQYFNDYVEGISCREASDSELVCFDCDGFIGIIIELNNRIPKLYNGRYLVWDGWFDEFYINENYGESLDEKVFNAKEVVRELEELQNFYNKITTTKQ